MKLRDAALKFIFLFCIIGLLVYLTFEEAKSLNFSYLSILLVTGVIGSYSLEKLFRLSVNKISNYLSDQTKCYRVMTFIGYIINLLIMPLLAVASSWQIAAFLLVFERVGKGVRLPSNHAKQSEYDRGCGLDRATDQIGAILGPLVITIFLYIKDRYEIGFAFLLVPAMIALFFLVLIRFFCQMPQEMRPQTLSIKTKGPAKRCWIYIIAVGLAAAGYSDFDLIGYHFQKAASISPIWIPFLYSIAMGVDSLASIVVGKFFDLKGISILALVTAVSSLFAPIVFLGNFFGLFIGMILWGICTGVQDSIMRVIVSSLFPPDKCWSVYGALNLAFGIFWALGSAFMGFSYNICLVYLLVFSVVAQIASIPIFLTLKIKREQ